VRLREVRVTHDHLNDAVSHPFGTVRKSPRHNQPTGKGVPIAMSGVIRNLGFRQRLVKPPAIIVL
jgi:hypothetical protein